MIAVMRNWLVVLLEVALIVTMCGAFSAVEAAYLNSVKVTPDLRRIVIESSGNIGTYNAFELDRPPRLVVDVKGLRPGNGPKMVPPARTGGLKIQVSESRYGAHVVLDFGGGPVPSYRIRRMDKYLIVFLGDWQAPAAVGPPKARPEAVSRVNPKSVGIPRKRAPIKRSPGKVSKASDLKIKSARVINGIIVLKVVDRANPERLFRVNLGVNLERRGFVSAGIYPVTPKGGASPSSAQLSPSSNRGRSGKASGGPRKIARPMESGRLEPKAHGFSGKLGSGPTKGHSVTGPTRRPRRVGPVGPVSFLPDGKTRGWKRNRFPLQSVSSTARAILQAYRRSPLLRFATCAFGPAEKSDPAPTVGPPSRN